MSREHGARMKEERSPKSMRKSARERLDGRQVGGKDAWALQSAEREDDQSTIDMNFRPCLQGIRGNVPD
jgi:hypothetical protein